jgi:hypothetical protein
MNKNNVLIASPTNISFNFLSSALTPPTVVFDADDAVCFVRRPRKGVLVLKR